MASTTTTMIAFKSALLAAIKTRAAGPGIWIGYGESDARMKRSVRLREAVTTEGTGQGVRPAGFRGGRPRLDEAYTLRVECEVMGLPDPLTNETAVVALGDKVEDAVFDPSVQSLANVWEAIPTSRGLDTDQAGNEVRSVYVITITVKART